MQSAKIFMNGRSQAIRLPKEFRFNVNEVYIRKDPETGDVIISRKPDSWDGFFDLLETTTVSDDFMNHRDNEPPQDRDLF